MALSIDEAIRRAQKVIEDLGIDYDARLTNDLANLEVAIDANDRESAIDVAHNIKGQAGSFGWPLVSAVANWLGQSLEAVEVPCDSKPIRLQLDSLCFLVKHDMRGEHPAGQKLIRELYAMVEHMGVLPSR